MVLTWRLRSRLDPRPSGGGAERRVGRLRRCCDRLSRGTSGPRYVKAHAAVRTAVGRLVVPTRRCEAAGTVAEHPTNVSSALRTGESPGECCPSHEAHGAYGYRQTTCVGLEWQQRREREPEKGNRNQGRVRPDHAPPKPASDRFSHLFRNRQAAAAPIPLKRVLSVSSFSQALAAGTDREGASGSLQLNANSQGRGHRPDVAGALNSGRASQPLPPGSNHHPRADSRSPFCGSSRSALRSGC